MREFLTSLLCGFIVGGLLSVGILEAQTTSGAIAGTVRDPAGRPVSEVVVQARSTETGLVRTAITDARGQYRLDSLTTGRWAVTASPAGGATSESQTAEIRLQEVLRLDFTFETSGTETVRVTAEAPMPDRRQTVGKLLVTQDQLDRVPLTGRVFTDLAKLDSAVGDPGGGSFLGERGAAFVVHGQGGRTNSFLVDGLDNNDPVSGSNLNAFYSQQVIKEFTLMTEQYAPEFGRASGGVLNIVTRQGGNDPTWSIFAQGTGGALSESSDFIDSLPGSGSMENDAKRLQYGFNVGGAFKKDRAFYFFAFERQDLTRLVPYTGYTNDDVFGGTVLGDSLYNNAFFRTDYNLGNRNQLMVRLTWDRRDDDRMNIGGVRTPDNGFSFKEQDLGLAASLKTIVSSRIVNEVRFMTARSEFDQLAESLLREHTRPSGITGGNALSFQQRNETRFQFVENLTFSSGRHTMKFGLDVTRSTIDLSTKFNPDGGLIFDTDNKPDFSDPGIPDQEKEDAIAQVFLLVQGEPTDTFDDTRFALFAQDSWDINDSWHLNYGLRYDLSSFQLDESARVDSVVPNGGATRDTDNIAPRFGFTYTPHADARWILRGGAGIFYDKLVLGFPAVSAITSQTRIRLFFPPIGSQQLIDSGMTFEEFLEFALAHGAELDDLWPDPATERRFAMYFSTAPELETPYTVQYNLGFDLSTTSRSAFRVNAVRSLGHDLPLMLDLNPVSGLIPNGVECRQENLRPDGILPCHLADTDVGSIVAITTEGRSWYWALDTSWRWQGQNGSWFSASYTLSRAEDTGFDPLKNGISIPPDSTDLSGERARSDTDRRHRLVLSTDVPMGWGGVRISSVARLSSGATFNVTTGQDNNLDGILTDRPAGINRNSGKDTSLSALNEFRLAEGLDPLNSLDEPTFFQIDLRIYKRFPFAAQKGTGELFLQVFNLLNRENFALIEGRATARNFGQGIALAGPPRSVELGVRFGF